MSHLQDEEKVKKKISLSEKLKVIEEKFRSRAMKNRVPFEGLQI